MFLFEERELLDATGAARTLLDTIHAPGSEWSKLAAYLSQRIPNFEAEIATLADKGEIELEGKAGTGLTLRAEWLGRVARLTLTDLSAEGQSVLVDSLCLRAQKEELSALRETLGSAPLLVWRTDADGAVCWANTAYLDCVVDTRGLMEDELTWPVPKLFSKAAREPDKPRRAKLEGQPETCARWYELHSLPAGSDRLNFALPADGEVRAETALREFIQTLTKTFAHLPIGLAIFDRQRKLALFNPALVDLTSIGAEFLSARPTLFAFLDRLREARVIPEPKDYQGWRQQMLELEKAAESGLYEETWTLPSGQTYRVIGRPHPDGAVAFLIEDITAEITLTRHFRSEIELGQSVVDTLDEAMAVFSPAGELIMSNTSYDALWEIDPDATLGTISIVDSMRIWQGTALPNPVFGEVRDFVSDLTERAEWSSDVRLLCGDVLTCRCAPLPGGASLVGFERRDAGRPQLRRAPRRRRLAVPATAEREQV
ncbi:PAS-domain containing protein [Albidovulum aquaemixtae]|nr:PAS-domain containing protein [Defluviimonas aquaemixtae]